MPGHTDSGHERSGLIYYYRVLESSTLLLLVLNTILGLAPLLWCLYWLTVGYSLPVRGCLATPGTDWVHQLAPVYMGSISAGPYGPNYAKLPLKTKYLHYLL